VQNRWTSACRQQVEGHQRQDKGGPSHPEQTPAGQKARRGGRFHLFRPIYHNTARTIVFRGAPEGWAAIFKR